MIGSPKPERRGRMITKRQAAEVGQKILEGFAQGRAIAIEQAKQRSADRAAKIILLFNEDVAKGRPAWGRAGRIARKLTDPLSESQVRRILSKLMSVQESPKV